MVVVEELGLITCEVALSTRVSGSSSARVHRVLLSEPTHMEDEDEDEDQENEVADERDGEECRVESPKRIKTTT